MCHSPPLCPTSTPRSHSPPPRLQDVPLPCVGRSPNSHSSWEHTHTHRSSCMSALRESPYMLDIPLQYQYKYNCTTHHITFTVSIRFLCCAELLPSSAAKMALTPIGAAQPKQVTAQGRKPRNMMQHGQKEWRRVGDEVPLLSPNSACN